MRDNKMSKAYWNSLYNTAETAWDIGYPSPVIKEYVEQLKDKNISVLIPGCGNAYEAEYMLQQGFTNITLLDIAPALTAALEKKFEKEPGERIRIITGDFFNHDGHYDLILEQTFLSALDPSARPKYVDKMHSLLKKGGHLTGVLFGRVFEEDGPPFGGTIQEYQLMFAGKFETRQLEPCLNSIEKRKNREIFINLVAK